MYNFEHIIEKVNDLTIEKYEFNEFFGSYKSQYKADSIHESYNKWKSDKERVFVGLWTNREDKPFHVYRYMNDSFYVISENEFVFSFEVNDIINLIIKIS